MRRRGIVRGALGVLVLGALCLPGTAAAQAAGAARYGNTNVILISLQCLRPDHLGAYGYGRDTSPNIDALARRSALFKQVIAQANLTPVAQMSVLTSEYPRVHGMVSFEVTKDQVAGRTLPEILRYYGYTTAAIVSSPEFFVRFDTASGTTVDTGGIYSRSFDQFETTRRGLGRRNIRKIPDESLDWIRMNKDKKFFLWIASGLLHLPYAAAVPEPDRSRYDPPKYVPFWQRLPQLTGGITADADPSYDVLSRVYGGDFYWGFSPIYHLTDADRAYITARYDAGVHYTDRFIGDLLKLLDSLHLTERTLIVLHSSHGDDLGERGRYFHYDVTDGVIRGALLIRFPGGAFGGKRVAQQVQSIDIMPTILDYLDIPAPHEAQGGSLLPLLTGGRSSAPSEYAYIDRIPWWEYTLSKWYLEFQVGRGAHFAPAERARLDRYRALLEKSFSGLAYPPGDIAVRTPEWKLVLRKDRGLLNRVSWWSFITGKKLDVDGIALYDLKNDPLETANVAAAHPDVVARLKERLLRWDASVEQRKAAYPKKGKHLIIPYP